jgi:peptidoglycan/LPS O-acetylase OafA/YrhL
VLLLIFRPRRLDLPILAVVEHSLAGAFFGSLLILAVAGAEGSIVRRFFSGRVLRFLGKYSYGLYVFHHLLRPQFLKLLPAEEWGARGGGGWGGVAAVAGYMAMAFGLSMAMALLSWHLLEKQFLKLKRWFEYRRVTRFSSICTMPAVQTA